MPSGDERTQRPDPFHLAGLPQDASARILGLLAERPAIQRVVLYELLVLGAQLDDLLLPWRIDLQLRHLIRHPGLLDHIDRVGITLATPRPASGQGQDVGAQQ